MPLPLLRRPEDESKSADRNDSAHYFDMAHGDVASLHERIERGLMQNAYVAVPHSVTADRIEMAVQAVSRGAGVVGLFGALALIAYALL